MLKFAVCPHDTKKGLKRWEELSKKLSEILGEEVKLITFKDFEEEENRVKKEVFDIYYARPVIVSILKEKGYFPVAKLKGVRERFLLVKKKGKSLEERVKASIVIEGVFSTLALISHFGSLTNVEINYEESYDEVLRNIVEDVSDVGVVFEEFFKNYEGKENFEVIDDFYIPNIHLFMVRKEVAERFRKAVEKVPKLIPADFSDLEFIEDILKLVKYFEEFRTAYDISSAVFTASKVGVLIYSDKILYANKYAQELLGYTLEELKNMSPEELVPEGREKEEVKKIIERRLKGEQFERVYLQLRAKRKDGKIIHLLAFSRTILYRGRYAGFVIFIDITDRVITEKLYAILKEINHTIIEVKTEEELFTRLCELLYRNFNLKSVEIFYSESYETVCSIGEKSSRRKVDTITIEDSFIGIPIKKNGKVIAILNMYLKEKEYLPEKVYETFEELQRDITFALEKIENLKRMKIISTAIENSDEIVIVFNEKLEVLYVNKGTINKTDWTEDEIINKGFKVFESEIFKVDDLKKLIFSRKERERVFIFKTKDGKDLYISTKILPVYLNSEEKVYVLIGIDITKELTLASELERLKIYDSLTGLYNFTGFSIKVKSMIPFLETYAVLALIDIVNMTFINNTYGFEVGNKVLKEIANRLRRNFRRTDIIGRIGGDEFGIFITGLRKKEDLFLIEEKLENIFEEPIKVNDETVRIDINGGIAVYPEDAKEFEHLYDRAMIALKEAVKEFPGEIKFFNPVMEDRAKKKLETEKLIDRAFKENLFRFYYQPYFYTDTLKIAGFEALVRIVNGDKVYPPYVFIEILEKGKYIRRFEDWALEEVLRCVRKWKLPISVNIYPKSLKDEAFLKKLSQVCISEKDRIIIEITERTIVENIDAVKRLFEEIKKFKCKINVSIDDFGTGYSALAYLKTLPADIIKIDISFISELTKGKREKALVKTIIDLAHAFGMQTIAEGVETQEQYEILKELGCDMVQGFLFAKPMPEEEIDKNLRNWL